MSNRNPDVIAVVPAYNEGQVIRATLVELASYVGTVACVDDGSSDDSYAQAKAAGVTVLHHLVNLGQGAALSTGIGYALTQPGWDYLVTFDSDGQHDPEDIDKLVAPLREGRADVVLGSRFLGTTEGMTKGKELLLKAGIVFTKATSRLHITDTHNGLRAFTRAAAEQIKITQPGMSHASEILHEIGKHKLRYVEAPTTVRYTEYSMAKGQSAVNAVNIVFEMFQKGIR